VGDRSQESGVRSHSQDELVSLTPDGKISKGAGGLAISRHSIGKASSGVIFRYLTTLEVPMNVFRSIMSIASGPATDVSTAFCSMGFCSRDSNRSG
jgi:hypothetical protein